MQRPLRIGINGFGRIGRMAFRLAWERDDMEVVAINDPTPTAELLLKRDSVHGIFPPEVNRTETSLAVKDEGKSWNASMMKTRDLNELEWGKHEVDIVLECSGRFRTRDTAGVHLEKGAKKVIISAPGKGVDRTICMGVNDHTLEDSDTLVSNASCTTNCLAPLVKVLDQKYGIDSGVMTTIHSYTNDQRILDLGHKDLRRARAAAINIIPTSTGAAKAMGEVWPNVAGKLDGFAIRVPTPNVSVVDFSAYLKSDSSVEEINNTFKEAASKDEWQGILGYCDEPLVSSDFIGSRYSSVFDSVGTTMVGKRLVKVLSWYDNEAGYTARLLDMAIKAGKSL
jgi:glyceraldehyde 3-phosphate dehydrogenase